MSSITTAAELFAGIGGFRLALNKYHLRCLYSNDHNKFSCTTYHANCGDIECADIRAIPATAIPSCDLLCAGFPCQPFSIAGVSKKQSLGQQHGFADTRQGNLFFEILRIVDYHRPKVILLENVKNLCSHDHGRTWTVINNALAQRHYTIFTQIIDGKHYVPQHRERIFIVCFNQEIFPDIDFEFPQHPQRRLYELRDILAPQVEHKYTLSDKLWQYLQQHKANSQAKGNGFGFGLVTPDCEYTRTLSARYYKDGSEILIAQPHANPRRLTPRECAYLQGFPHDFMIPVSDAQAYRQFGNAVIVPVVDAILAQIICTVNNHTLGLARQKNLSLF